MIFKIDNLEQAHTNETLFWRKIILQESKTLGEYQKSVSCSNFKKLKNDVLEIALDQYKMST